MNKEDSIDRPSAPLPHFQVLREEIEDDTVRVREFLKGSFTYKVEERENVRAADQGSVVQSVVSLTSSLRVISLTVLADSMYNILIFFAEKM